MNPARVFAEQFVRRSPTAWLTFGVALSLFDFATLFGAAASEHVLTISGGVGLLDNFGLFSTLIGNAVFLYVAKKYYDGVCAIRASKAVISTTCLNSELSALTLRITLRGHHRFMLYGFLTVGMIAWLSNVSGHVLDVPEVRWGHHVFDSPNHPWTFVASRLHNIYTWLVVTPFLAHVMIYSSLHLRRMVNAAAQEGALAYDLLNPDQRGGFVFVDNSNILFNIVVALTYVQVTLHIGTFDKLNAEHITAYIALTLILILINRMFLGDIYGLIKHLRLDALNRLKDDVYNHNKLSFDILRYCYDRKLSAFGVVNLMIKAIAIVIPGIVRLWPSIVRTINGV